MGGKGREAMKKNGFTMIEVLLALAMLAVGLSVASSLFTRGELVHRYSRERVDQIQLAARVLAELRLSGQPQRAGEELLEHSSAPQLRYRVRTLPAVLPEELRLVEVEVVAIRGAGKHRCRGVVPSGKAAVPGKPVPAASTVPAPALAPGGSPAPANTPSPGGSPALTPALSSGDASPSAPALSTGDASPSPPALSPGGSPAPANTPTPGGSDVPH